jgi:tripartite motif-containing protein 71
MSEKFLFYLSLCLITIMVAGCSGGEKGAYTFVTMWGSKGTGNGQFQYAEDFAFDSEGNLLVTDALNCNVQVFTKNGEFITKFGSSGSRKDNSEFEKPEGIVIDPKTGNIFIADYTSGYIKKFDKDYNWLMTFSGYGTDEGLNMESEFMCIASNGLLYMA